MPDLAAGVEESEILASSFSQRLSWVVYGFYCLIQFQIDRCAACTVDTVEERASQSVAVGARFPRFGHLLVDLLAVHIVHYRALWIDLLRSIQILLYLR